MALLCLQFHCAMKRLWVFLLPINGMLVQHRVIVPALFKFSGIHLYTWVDRSTVRVKCLAPAWARTWTAQPDWSALTISHCASLFCSVSCKLIVFFPFFLSLLVEYERSVTDFCVVFRWNCLTRRDLTLKSNSFTWMLVCRRSVRL